jgi:hypothetical protein
MQELFCGLRRFRGCGASLPATGCGAFVDERRVVVATQADGCTNERAQPERLQVLRSSDD